MKTISAAIIGATGYAGVELARLLCVHPNVEKLYLSSVSFEGQNITDIYPNLADCLNEKTDGTLLSADEAKSACDVLFTALPNGLAEEYAYYCVKNGKKLIDLSADFRFHNEETFKKWYGSSWKYPAVHCESVYGLPEYNRRKIKEARVVGNPGCYVTCATLALIPALLREIIDTSDDFPIIIDAKSGVTGAGRSATMTNQFCECGEAFSAYKVGSHRHQPEIQKNCEVIIADRKGCAYSDCAPERKVSVIFTPHLVPMSRGIFSTIYARLSQTFTKEADNSTSADEIAERIRQIYREHYKDERFVRVLKANAQASTKNVRLSNFCDIQLYVVNGGKTLQITSVIDNMQKGSSAQAVQNMNIMFGFDESAGIGNIPSAF